MTCQKLMSQDILFFLSQQLHDQPAFSLHNSIMSKTFRTAFYLTTEERSGALHEAFLWEFKSPLESLVFLLPLN